MKKSAILTLMFLLFAAVASAAAPEFGRLLSLQNWTYGEGDYIGYPNSIATGDINNDGYSDAVMGAYGWDGCGTNCGRAFVYLGNSSGGLTLRQNFTGTAAVDVFGFSVASGDINNDNYSDFLIGVEAWDGCDAGNDCGAVFVYLGNSSGSLTLHQNLTGNVAGELAGTSVATADINNDDYDDVIVGAWFYNTQQGRALLYLGNSSGGLTLQQNLTGNVAGERFGYSAAAGDINNDNYDDVIIGADGYNSQQGRALLYLGNSSGGLTLQQNLTGNFAGEKFSEEITIGNFNNDNYDDVIIGAYNYHDNGYGRALVYLGNSSGGLTLQQNLTENTDWDSFGMSVAAGNINNDSYLDLIVGAEGYPDGNYDGRALLYLGNSSGGFTLKQNLTGISGSAESFGSDTEIADIDNDGYGDVIVGAYSYPNWDCDGRISIYKSNFRISNQTWNEDASLANAFDLDDYFLDEDGDSLAYTAAGNSSITVRIGSDGVVNFSQPADWYGTETIYFTATDGSGSADSNNITLTVVNDESDDPKFGKLFLAQNFTSSSGSGEGFGWSFATADINNDNYDDVIIGAYGYNSSQGRALLYLGNSSGGLTLHQNLTGNVAGELFGWPIATSDINNDNYDDVIIGANFYNSAQGRALLYLGNSSGGLTLHQNLTGNVAGELFGRSVAAGDINNDSYDDVIIGAYGYNNYQGRALLYLGNSSGGLTLQQNLTGNVAGEYFGVPVAAGDINNDNYDDVVVGGVHYNSWQGRALLYLGNSSGGLTLHQNLTGNVAGERFGGFSAATGDINNDNYSDVMIGAPYWGGCYAGDDCGRALLYLGNSSGGLTLQQNLTGNAAGDEFSMSSIATGNINNDDYDDAIIGADGYPGSWDGRALLYLGNSSGELTLWQNLTGISGSEESFGFATATGDINNDNYDDVIIGAYAYPNWACDGRAELYKSNFNIPSQIWNENAGLANAFDLDDYFSDTNNATLNYNATGNSNIQVSIASNGIVSFSQAAGWYGSETIYFTASDGISSANSNMITLTVTNVNEPVVQTYTMSSGGDASSSPAIGSTTNPYVSRLWKTLNKGDTAVMEIKELGISFMKVEMNVNKNLNDAEIRVEKLAAYPSSAKPLEAKVYQYLDVKQRNIDKADIDKIAIKFKVSSSWLENNDVDKEDIVLKIYKENEWKNLPTILISGNKITGNAIMLKDENDASFFTAFIGFLKEIFNFFKNSITGFAIKTTFVLYEAESDSLGSFAVAVKEKPAETLEEKPEECIESWQCTEWSICTYEKQERECKDLNNCNTFENRPAEERKCALKAVLSPAKAPVKPASWILIGLALAAFLAVCYYGYMAYSNKRKGKIR